MERRLTRLAAGRGIALGLLLLAADGPAREAEAVTPPIDREAPAKVETATFAVG